MLPRFNGQGRSLPLAVLLANTGFNTYHLTSYGFFSRFHVDLYRIEGVIHHIRRSSIMIPLFILSDYA
jgi:hypothetical protein